MEDDYSTQTQIVINPTQIFSVLHPESLKSGMFIDLSEIKCDICYNRLLISIFIPKKSLHAIGPNVLHSD